VSILSKSQGIWLRQVLKARDGRQKKEKIRNPPLFETESFEARARSNDERGHGLLSHYTKVLIEAGQTSIQLRDPLPQLEKAGEEKRADMALGDHTERGMTRLKGSK
jgi:hypothetical protein